MSRFGTLYRGSRRIPMTAKRGHEYYKGNRSGAIGSHTKKGGYRIDIKKVRNFIVPDLTDFKIKPYVFTPRNYLYMANKYAKDNNLIDLYYRPNNSNSSITAQEHQKQVD
nr:5510_t:CDS:2 [Entrophospora candida]